MSIVSEALKKVEETRGGYTGPGSPPIRRSTPWIWPVVLIAILVVAGTLAIIDIGLRRSRGRSGTDEPAAPPENPVAEEATPASTTPAVAAPDPPPPGAVSISAVETVPVETPLEADEPVEPLAPAPVADEDPAESAAGEAEEVSLKGEQDLAAAEPAEDQGPTGMKVSGIAYSPRQRLARVGGRLVKEGDMVDGYRVAAIGQTTVTLERDGTRYDLEAER